MSTATPLARMTPAEYLAWEREQVDKHELIDGHVFAGEIMTDAKLPQSTTSFQALIR